MTTLAAVLSVQAVFFEDCDRARGDIEVGLYTTAPFIAAYAAAEFVLACVVNLPHGLVYGLATRMDHWLMFGFTLAGMAFYFSLLSLLTCACAYTYEDALSNMTINFIVHLASCHLVMRPKDLPPFARFVNNFSFIKPMMALLVNAELGPRSVKFLQFDFRDRGDAISVTIGTFLVPLMFLVNTKLHAVRARVHVVAENAQIPSKATEDHYDQVLKIYEKALLQHGVPRDEIRKIAERADINLAEDNVIAPKREIDEAALNAAAAPEEKADAAGDEKGDDAPLPLDESGLLAPQQQQEEALPGALPEALPSPTAVDAAAPVYDVGDEVQI